MAESKQKLESRIEENFAAPEFRKNQKEVIRSTVEAFNEGKDVVCLSAPTGFGKSLVLESIAQITGPSFYATPLNALVDQLDDDEFISDRVITIKGRNNYDCVHPEDMGTPVDEAICQRDSGFECEIKEDQCPYYSRKYRALDHNCPVTNIAYLMAEGLVPANDKSFGVRNTLVVDECQSIEDFAMNFISVTISPRSVPDDIWGDITIPNVDDDSTPIEEMVEWLKDHVIPIVNGQLEFYDRNTLKSKQQTKEEEQLRNFYTKVKNLIRDIKDNEWIYQIDTVTRKNRRNDKKIVFKPVFVGRFLKNLLWSKADNILLSSATIPGGDWLDEIGLGDKSVRNISVSHEFPVENRPIVMGEDVGKMTYKKRKSTVGPMAEKIIELANHYEGQKGMIHCRAYSIAKMLRRSMINNGYNDFFTNNVMVQDRYNREESLQEWINSDYQVFFSVAMDEGINLEEDKCRWQVLAKVLYESMNDRRTKYRVSDLGDWDWYNRKAAVQIQQAYGRAVRSKEDWAHFYVLDSSAKGLVKRDAELFQSWFLEAIGDMAVDPDRGM